jgi:mannose-1-phosphate guanylyltransferase
VAVIPADFAWHDVGDFQSLSALLPMDDASGNQIMGDGDVISQDAAGNLVMPYHGRLVALLGVDDLVVVDTADVLLIAARSRSQMVGQMAEMARELGF